MLSSTEVHTVLWLEVASGMKEEECTLSEDKGDIFDEGVGALKGGGGSLNEGVGALKGGGGNLDSFAMFARCLLQTSLKWYSRIAVLSGTLAPAGTFLENTDKICAAD